MTDLIKSRGLNLRMEDQTTWKSLGDAYALKWILLLALDNERSRQVVVTREPTKLV